MPTRGELRLGLWFIGPRRLCPEATVPGQARALGQVDHVEVTLLRDKPGLLTPLKK
jgi:hypothetical protein